jgi:hypothetical protein
VHIYRSKDFEVRNIRTVINRIILNIRLHTLNFKRTSVEHALRSCRIFCMNSFIRIATIRTNIKQFFGRSAAVRRNQEPEMFTKPVLVKQITLN